MIIMTVFVCDLMIKQNVIWCIKLLFNLEVKKIISGNCNFTWKISI